jgi:prophage regulatory protein
MKKIIRRRTLVEMTGLSLSTVYRLISRREFPAAIRLSTNAVGWALDDVQAWIDQRRSLGNRRLAVQP